MSTYTKISSFFLSGGILSVSLTQMIPFCLTKVPPRLRQGSHRLEKYLNLECFLEKSLKIKYALKSTGKSLRGLEKSLNIIFSAGLNSVDRDLNQYEIVVPLFGAANAAPNKGIIF